MNDQPSDVTVPTGTQRLLIACGDTAMLRSVEGLFGSAMPAPALTGCDGIEAALAQDAAAPIVVPVTLPLDHLREALQAGTAPDDALADWRAEAEALLRTCRKARRRVLLIDAGMLETQPDICARELGARLNLRFGAVPQKPQTMAGRSAIHAVIAAALLASDVQALDLLDEIEAMILGPVSPRSPARAQIASATQVAAALTEERDLLRDSMAQMLAETEDLEGALTRKEREVGALEDRVAGVGDLEGRLAQAEAAHDSLTEEYDLLRGSMAQMLAESEELRGALTRKEKEAKALEDQGARVEDLEDKLAQADAAHDSLTEERDLLRETLAQMLGENERLLSEEGDLKSKLEARNTELADKHLLKAQLDAVTRQIDAAREAQRWRDSVLGDEVLKLSSKERDARNTLSTELHAASTELHAAHDEIARILGSRSWKVTRPLRAARRRLSRL